jgi:hypothetical protein
MADLVRIDPEDFDALGHQMRLANTARLKAILDQLEPYVDGSLGPNGVSPAHVNAYIKVVRELGLLWRSYDRPSEVKGPDGGDEERLVLEARRSAVAAELDKLAQVAGQSAARGRRAS